jgi:phosphate transport system substrate-binding protein
MQFSKKFVQRSMQVAVAASLSVAMIAGSTGSAFAGLSGSLKLGGSTTVQPLAQLLANQFHKVNPGVNVTVAGGGSGVGIDGTTAGTWNIGMSSNTLSQANLDSGLVGTTMAKDAVTFVVNPKNKVKALTIAQCKKIWTGKITNWKQLGGVSHKIDVYGRAAGSGTGDFVNKNVFGDADGKAPWTGSTSPTLVSTLKTYGSNGELRNAVAGDKYAIGYVGMAYATSKVRGIKLNGYLATRANAKAGKYPIVRNLWWVTKGAPTGLSKSFIDYSLSSGGQALVNKLYMSLK